MLVSKKVCELYGIKEKEIILNKQVMCEPNRGYKDKEKPEPSILLHLLATAKKIFLIKSTIEFLTVQDTYGIKIDMWPNRMLLYSFLYGQGTREKTLTVFEITRNETEVLDFGKLKVYTAEGKTILPTGFDAFAMFTTFQTFWLAISKIFFPEIQIPELVIKNGRSIEIITKTQNIDPSEFLFEEIKILGAVKASYPYEITVLAGAHESCRYLTIKEIKAVRYGDKDLYYLESVDLLLELYIIRTIQNEKECFGKLDLQAGENMMRVYDSDGIRQRDQGLHWAYTKLWESLPTILKNDALSAFVE